MCLIKLTYKKILNRQKLSFPFEIRKEGRHPLSPLIFNLGLEVGCWSGRPGKIRSQGEGFVITVYSSRDGKA